LSARKNVEKLKKRINILKNIVQALNKKALSAEAEMFLEKH